MRTPALLIALLALSCGPGAPPARTEALIGLSQPAPPAPASAAVVPSGSPASKPDLAPDAAASIQLAPAAATAVQATPAPDARPRIGSIKWLTYIWPSPARPRNHLPIGAIRYGMSVPLRGPDPVKGGGCSTRWYAVEPVGYVCADDTTTFDFDSPYWKAPASPAPGPGPLPYRYAFSTGAPMYFRVPTKEEQANAEKKLGPVRTFKSVGKWSQGHERLVSLDPADAIKATDAIPEYFRDHRSIPGSPFNATAKPKVRTIPAGSGFSYVKAFEAAGRTWLLTPELLLVPADRVFPYKASSFRGVTLGGDVKLPVAWVRGASEKKWRRAEDGSFRETGDAWGGKAPVPLTGALEKAGKVVYRETREPGVWIAEAEGVSVVEAATELPSSIQPGEKWIEARILPGTMVAYEGLMPVWMTLWSGGTGGVPVKGNDPIKYSTTSLGIFPIQWKDRVATMSPDKGAVTSFWLADVPHIQYTRAPIAVHVAYWHEDFGYLRSAACLNVSPIDGEHLFNWTLPALPEGWGAVRPSKAMGPSTKVVVKPT